MNNLIYYAILVLGHVIFTSFGQMVQSERIGELLQKCTDLTTDVYTPECAFGNYENGLKRASDATWEDWNAVDAPCFSMTVGIMLVPDQFVSIDDPQELFSLTGTIMLYWLITCVTYSFEHKSIIPLDLSNNVFWRPNVIHVNAEIDHDMSSGFTTSFMVEYLPRNDDLVGFSFNKYGLFTSRCELTNFQHFPWDTEVCSVNFELLLDASAATFRSFRFDEHVQPKEGFITPSSGWTLVGGVKQTFGFNQKWNNRSISTFSYTLRRNPDFYIYSLILPCFFLTFLQLFGLLLAPESADRPVFAVTLLLAIVFLQGQIQAGVPKKPQRCFLLIYADVSAILSLVCTLYSLVTCFLATNFSNWFHRFAFKMSKDWPVKKLIDVIFGLTIFAAFSTVNLYAIVYHATTQ